MYEQPSCGPGCDRETGVETPQGQNPGPGPGQPQGGPPPGYGWGYYGPPPGMGGPWGPYGPGPEAGGWGPMGPGPAAGFGAGPGPQGMGGYGYGPAGDEGMQGPGPGPRAGRGPGMGQLIEEMTAGTGFAGLGQFLDFEDTDFWKGALVGAAAVLLLTNETVQQSLFKSGVKARDVVEKGFSSLRPKAEQNNDATDDQAPKADPDKPAQTKTRTRRTRTKK
ncbi:MAG: hypothetical protein V2J42_01115 [Wenzhouxiangella sp.]|nr:hypothetical protein [Wenzhouxiangella sp.]